MYLYLKKSKIKGAIKLLLHSKDHEIKLNCSKLYSRLYPMLSKFSNLTSDTGSSSVRNNIRQNFSELLMKHFEEVSLFDVKELQLEHITAKAISLETDVFQLFKKDIMMGKTNEYKKKAHLLYMKISSNKELRGKILNDEIKTDELVLMNEEQLTNKEIIDKRNKKIEEDFNARRNDWNKLQQKGKEGFYTCFKCRTNNTSYYQAQTRRADEGMTTFVECHTCNNRWKC